MWNLKNKTNKQNRNRLGYSEQTDGCQRGGGLGDWVRKVGDRETQIGSCRSVTGMSSTTEGVQSVSNYVCYLVGTGNAGCTLCKVCDYQTPRPCT